MSDPVTVLGFSGFRVQGYTRTTLPGTSATRAAAGSLSSEHVDREKVLCSKG